MPQRKPKNRGGRPLKWKPEAIAPLAIAFNRHDSMAGAAKRAGIDKSSQYRWIRVAEKGAPRFAARLPLVQGARRAWFNGEESSRSNQVRWLITPGGRATPSPWRCERFRAIVLLINR